MSTSDRSVWTTSRSRQMRIATMTPIFVIPLVLFGLIYPLRAEDAERPEYINCQSNSECGLGYCCSIGPIRYSIPQCKAMQAEGEVCRPSSTEPQNMTVGYPDGAQVKLIDVHYILCPCSEGFFCDPKEGLCKSIVEKEEGNRVFDESVQQDN